MSEVVYSGYCTYCKTPLHPEKQTREALSDMMREHVAVCEKHPARALERENAALREAALKAVHTIGKALHGEGKDFRDLDHTYKLLIDLLPAEVLSQDTAQAKVPGRPCEHGVPLLEHCEICDGGEK